MSPFDSLESGSACGWIGWTAAGQSFPAEERGFTSIVSLLEESESLVLRRPFAAPLVDVAAICFACFEQVSQMLCACFHVMSVE